MVQSNPFFADAVNWDSLLQLAALVAGIALLAWGSRRFFGIGRKRRYFRRKSGFRPVIVADQTSHRTNVADPHTQMDAIAQVDFETTPLLNREEARILPVLERTAKALGRGYRVMAQTSLGEVIRPKSVSATATLRDAAYASINSKRLDFAVFDRFGKLIAAVEYQGSGHHQNRAFLRDAVKREAVRKAGVPFLEFDADSSDEEIERRLRSCLGEKDQDGLKQ